MTVIEADAAPASSEMDEGSASPELDRRAARCAPVGSPGGPARPAGGGGTSGPSDLELWESTRSGEAWAFGVLYERHVDAVHTHCFRRTGSWTLAEDLTSSVFLETWRRRDVVELTTGSMLPWLLGTANNVIRHQLRTLLRHRRALSRLPSAVTTPDHSEDATERLDAERQMRQVLGAVNRLTMVEREVVALCVWSGLSYADAAVAMGVPVGTVRSRLARARERLRELSTGPSTAEPGPSGGTAE